MILSRYEMETVINFNLEDDKAVLYTADKSIMRKLDRLISRRPDLYQLISSDSISKQYTFPKKMITFRVPAELTDEQKEKRRLQGIAAARKNFTGICPQK